MAIEDTITSAIEQVANTLTEHFTAQQLPSLTASVEAWKQHHGLDNAASPDRMLARQAAYNTLLKTTLYASYRVDRDDLSPLTADAHHSDIPDQFAHAYTQTTDIAFTDSVLDEYVWTLTDDAALAPLLAVRHHLVNADSPTETIGRLYEAISPQASRRSLGQFRTPPHVATLMAQWAVRSATDTVLDPGMGAGVLTAKAWQAKQQRRGRAEVTDMIGIDTSPLSVVMGATALQLNAGPGTPSLHVADFFEMAAPASAQTASTNAVLPPVDAIVANPPYTRHQDLDSDTKDRLQNQVRAESMGSLSRQSPLYAYFLIYATQFLKPGGRLALLTPAEYLETTYGETLKQFLLDHFDIHALVVDDRDTPIFEQAETTSCVAFLERTTAETYTTHTDYIRLTEWPPWQTLQTAISDDVREVAFGSVTTVEQPELDSTSKWTQYFGPQPLTALPHLTPLRDLATVKRGILTGANDYFCLSQHDLDDWNLDPTAPYLVPLIRNAHSCQHYDCTPADHEAWVANGAEAWLLYLADCDEAAVTDDRLTQYLEHGRHSDVPGGYVTSNRTPWYAVDRRKPAPILATYMSSDEFRFIQNTANVRSLNNLHTIYPDETYSPVHVKALLAYLNSGVARTFIEHHGRSYAKGLQKLEPGELKDLPVLDPTALRHHHVRALANQFEELCHASRSTDADPAAVITEIDAYLHQLAASSTEVDGDVQNAVGQTTD